MARYFGKVGYGLSVDQGAGVWIDQITEKEYQGDLIKDNRKLDANDNTGGNISVQNSISVVADDWTMSNFTKIRYVEWSGVNWTVSAVEVVYPRLILRLGEVYNGPTA